MRFGKYHFSWGGLLINTSPPIPPFWEQVKAGCYVDTMAFDESTEGSCSSAGERMGSEAVIVFSVGDQYTGDIWVTTTPGVAVIWSGDCTGSGTSCSVRGTCSFNGGNAMPSCPALGTKRATATVTFNGETRTFTITGVDNTRNNSGPIE